MVAVRQHRQRSPDTAGTFLHPVDTDIQRSGDIAVFFRHLQKSWTDDAVIGSMTVETIRRFHQGQTGGFAATAVEQGAQYQSCGEMTRLLGRISFLDIANGRTPRNSFAGCEKIPFLRAVQNHLGLGVACRNGD